VRRVGRDGSGEMWPAQLGTSRCHVGRCALHGHFTHLKTLTNSGTPAAGGGGFAVARSSVAFSRGAVTDRKGHEMGAHKLQMPDGEPSDANGGARPHTPAAPGITTTGNISHLPSADRRAKLRILEALLFAASEPLDEVTLSKHLKSGDDIKALIEELQGFYASRGVNLVRVAGKWAFRTADDLSYLLERHAKEERKLSRAAMETMAIIAYHQPVTRAEIEEIRGVATSGGTLDVLMETGWIRPRGRRRAPGRPITYGTTAQFLEHFGMDAIKDLPGLAELKGAGLLDNTLPPDFTVPEPTDVAALMPDEVPLEALEEAHQARLPLDEPDDEETLADDDEAPATS
jgi:segregation and condensation protein B